MLHREVTKGYDMMYFAHMTLKDKYQKEDSICLKL